MIIISEPQMGYIHSSSHRAVEICRCHSYSVFAFGMNTLPDRQVTECPFPVTLMLNSTTYMLSFSRIRGLRETLELYNLEMDNLNMFIELKTEQDIQTLLNKLLCSQNMFGSCTGDMINTFKHLCVLYIKKCTNNSVP